VTMVARRMLRRATSSNWQRGGLPRDLYRLTPRTLSPRGERRPCANLRRESNSATGADVTDRAASPSFESRHARVRRSLTSKTSWRPAIAGNRCRRADGPERHRTGRRVRASCKRRPSSDGTGGGIWYRGRPRCHRSAVTSLEEESNPWKETKCMRLATVGCTTDSSVEENLRPAGGWACFIPR
jgi:hypothetical protein